MREDRPERPETIAWTSHPVREEPRRTWIVFLFVVLTGAALWVSTRSGYWVGFGTLVLFAAAREWFFPTHYRLDENGASRRFWFVTRVKPWDQVRRAGADRRGVLLSPFPFPSRLETFRGLYLRFSGNRDTVMEFIDRQIAAHRKT